MKAMLGILLPALVMGSGCTSVPVRYHTLVPEAAHDPRPSPDAVRLRVEPVSIPAQVDRLELVTRPPEGGIAVAEGERWIAPLADELQSALTVELLPRLASGEGPESAFAGALSVQVQVERFESAPSRYALIEASWAARCRSEHDEHVILGHTRALEPVGAGYAELVRGHQRAIARVADAVAAALRGSLVVRSE